MESADATRHPHPSRPDHAGRVALLAELGERIAPVSLAVDRVLPVVAPLDELFPERGVVRGRVLATRGSAATTVALGLAAAAMGEGAWLAVVDLPVFGADAAAEIGVPLGRVVRVDTAPAGGAAGATTGGGAASAGVATPADGAAERAAVWIDVMGAAVDGFDLVVATVPPALRVRPSSALRKLLARIQRRGAVVVLVGDHGAVAVDGTVSTEVDTWSGLGQGWGHLRHRTLGLAAHGRRAPGVRRCRVDLVPGIAASSDGPVVVAGTAEERIGAAGTSGASASAAG
jgi:hypothetical protein